MNRLCEPLTRFLASGSTPGVARRRATTGAWPWAAAICRGVTAPCRGGGGARGKREEKEGTSGRRKGRESASEGGEGRRGAGDAASGEAGGAADERRGPQRGTLDYWGSGEAFIGRPQSEGTFAHRKARQNRSFRKYQ